MYNIIVSRLTGSWPLPVRIIQIALFFIQPYQLQTETDIDIDIHAIPIIHDGSHELLSFSLC